MSQQICGQLLVLLNCFVFCLLSIVRGILKKENDIFVQSMHPLTTLMYLLYELGLVNALCYCALPKQSVCCEKVISHHEIH